jgi:hypothetical protein
VKPLPLLRSEKCHWKWSSCLTFGCHVVVAAAAVAVAAAVDLPVLAGWHSEPVKKSCAAFCNKNRFHGISLNQGLPDLELYNRPKR